MNWNQVCHGGLAVGALALRREEPDLAAQIVHRAVVNVPRAVAVCRPDGAYPEGPSYWEFGTSFSAFLIEALETALGTDFGLADLPGFQSSAAFMLHATGPTGLTFNFSDGHAGRRNSATLYWLARRFGAVVLPPGAAEEAVWQGRPETLGRGEMAMLSPLWRACYPEPAAGQPALPRDRSFRGSVPVVMFRGSWSDANAVYLAVKAGSPGATHGHMDGGSFVMEARGVRWAFDLGSENYHRAESTGMNFWDRAQGGDRWRFFRQGASSHNTLVIDGGGQRVDGAARVVSFSDDAGSPSVTLDLTGLYAGQAAGVTRAFTLPGRREVVVADRLTGLKPGSRVRWAMVTPAEASVEAAAMLLRRGAERMRIEVTGAGSAAWQVTDLARPPNEFDSPNPGYRMVWFEAVAPASGALAWRVTLSPLAVPASR
jgi:hypothetical protein